MDGVELLLSFSYDIAQLVLYCACVDYIGSYISSHYNQGRFVPKTNGGSYTPSQTKTFLYDYSPNVQQAFCFAIGVLAIGPSPGNAIISMVELRWKLVWDAGYPRITLV